MFGLTIIEVFVALLIAIVMLSRLSATSHGIGQTIVTERKQHQRFIRTYSSALRAQSELVIKGEPGPSTSLCTGSSTGEYFDSVTCEESETEPFQILTPKGFLLVELLVGIMLLAIFITSVPTIVRTNIAGFKKVQRTDALVAEEELLSSLLLSQLRRSSAIPGVQTFKAHPLGSVTDPLGASLPVTSTVANKPAPGFTPISFVIPDVSYVFVPNGSGQFCLHYRTAVSTQRTAVSTISRYLALSLSGASEFPGKGVTAPNSPLCPNGTYNLTSLSQSSVSTVHPMNTDASTAFLLIPVKDEFTIYRANSGALRRMSNLTTENQPLLTNSSFGFIATPSLNDGRSITYDIALEPSPISLTAISSVNNPVAALDLRQ